MAETARRPTPSPEYDDSGIARLRSYLTDEIRRRVHAALGPDADPTTTRTLEQLYAGALIDAGVDYASHVDGGADPGLVVLRLLHR